MDQTKPKLPDEALKYAIDYCLENKFSCIEMGDDHVYVFIMGRNTLSADQAAIVISHMLLEGVMSGTLMQSNLEAMYPQGYTKPS